MVPLVTKLFEDSKILIIILCLKMNCNNKLLLYHIVYYIFYPFVSDIKVTYDNKNISNILSVNYSGTHSIYMADWHQMVTER